jgi:hypothetical protein
MVKPETIKQLAVSKRTCETEVREAGKKDALKLIEEKPDYLFLCDLLDAKDQWRNDNSADIDFVAFDIDGPVEFPAPLRFCYLEGFFMTISQVEDELKPAQLN